MGEINKIWNLIKYYGVLEFCTKVFEKVIIDKKRFSSNIERKLPDFNYEENKNCREYLLLEGGKESKGIPYSKRRKIYYLIHCFYPYKQGGTERFLLNLAQEQQLRGYDVRIFTFSENAEKMYDFYDNGIYYKNYTYESVPVVEMRYKKTPKGMYYKEFLDETNLYEFAMKLMQREKPDIVHCVYPQIMAAFLKACRESKIPYIVTLTDFNILCHYATMVDKQGNFCMGCNQGKECLKKCKSIRVKDSKARYEKAEKLLEGAELITAPSKFVANMIEKEFKKVYVKVIPHGISDKFYCKQSRTCTNKIAYLGTISELKGIHILVQAFKEFYNVDICLDIYGAGNSSYIGQLKKISYEDKRITLKGKVEPSEMPKVYNQYDVIVVPSIWYETYNFVVREALQCGCLVICSDIGAMPEIIKEGKNGFLAEAGNIESLKKVLSSAIIFDWKKYEQIKLPQIKDEADRYSYIYKMC